MPLLMLAAGFFPHISGKLVTAVCALAVVVNALFLVTPQLYGEPLTLPASTLHENHRFLSGSKTTGLNNVLPHIQSRLWVGQEPSTKRGT